MENFKEWLNNGPEAELNAWVSQLQLAIMHSIRPSEGFISLQVKSLIKNNPMASQANLEHSVNEVKGPGWKGKATIANLSDKINWNQSQKNSFEKGMNAGQNSLPNTVGKEMGLLFEVNVFLHLLHNYKLKAIGKDVNYVIAEKSKIIDEINQKAARLSTLVVEFIDVHATEMAEMIYKKATSLITQCKIDCIEFTGGGGASYSQNYQKMKGDTADLRIGCSRYMEGDRKDIGFSLKASTETQQEVRAFSPTKTIAILGGSHRQQKHIHDIFNTPIMDVNEKREELMKYMGHLATKNFANRPKKFASLMATLVTGGADTLPAYKNLTRGNGEPGWSGAVQKDLNTNENPGMKLSNKMGATVEVNANSTYIALKYMVPGGNHYGTIIKFQPDTWGKSVSVGITGLNSKGGRGY